MDFYLRAKRQGVGSKVFNHPHASLTKIMIIVILLYPCKVYMPGFKKVCMKVFSLGIFGAREVRPLRSSAWAHWVHFDEHVAKQITKLTTFLVGWYARSLPNTVASTYIAI